MLSRSSVSVVVVALIACAVAIVGAQSSSSSSSSSGSGAPTYYIMGLQKCTSSASHTIHGLWPQYSATNENPSFCSGSSFSRDKVADLWTNLNKYWFSCPKYHKPTLEFLSHEWSKHGTCSGFTQHHYFNVGLQIFMAGSWRSGCQSYQSECKVHVYIPTVNASDARIMKITGR